MTDLLAIARVAEAQRVRLGLEWLPGMLVRTGAHSLRVVTTLADGRHLLAWTTWDGSEQDIPVAYSSDEMGSAVPDLSDTLTRLGLLEWVRQVYGPLVYTRCMAHSEPDRDPWWYVFAPSASEPSEWRWRRASPTELEALVAVLVAAPDPT